MSRAKAVEIISLLLRFFLLGLIFLGFGIGWESGLDQGAARAVVDADDPLLAAGGDHRTVRARTDAVEEVRGAGVLPHVAAVLGVPHADGRVAGDGEELRRLAHE